MEYLCEGLRGSPRSQIGSTDESGPNVWTGCVSQRENPPCDRQISITGVHHRNDDSSSVIANDMQPILQQCRVECGCIAEKMACAGLVVVSAKLEGEREPAPIAQDQRAISGMHDSLRLGGVNARRQRSFPKSGWRQLQHRSCSFHMACLCLLSGCRLYRFGPS